MLLYNVCYVTVLYFKGRLLAVMPPKVKYTREEILEAAFSMARENGIESVVARELGKRLGTSSSPIFTAFKNMEELWDEIRKLALKEFEDKVKDALKFTPAAKYIGMMMIDFAETQPHLFRLVYMREHDANQTYEMLIDELGDVAQQCVEIMEKDYDLNTKDATLLFKQIWLHTFGICVLVAGKVCSLTKDEISEMLSMDFQGNLMLIKSGKFHTVKVSTMQ